MGRRRRKIRMCDSWLAQKALQGCVEAFLDRLGCSAAFALRLASFLTIRARRLEAVCKDLHLFNRMEIDVGRVPLVGRVNRNIDGDVRMTSDVHLACVPQGQRTDPVVVVASDHLRRPSFHRRSIGRCLRHPWRGTATSHHVVPSPSSSLPSHWWAEPSTSASPPAPCLRSS